MSSSTLDLYLGVLGSNVSWVVGCPEFFLGCSESSRANVWVVHRPGTNQVSRPGVSELQSEDLPVSDA
jgi:hypothetical protein